MAGPDRLKVVLYSFGYKYGTPVDVNLVVDVRFLPNPYWVEELRPKTGQVAEVADHVLQSSEGVLFLETLEPLLHFLSSQYRAGDGKTLRIAIGCTGGRHRSVAVTEKIGAWFRARTEELTVFHRDIDRDTTS